MFLALSFYRCSTEQSLAYFMSRIKILKKHNKFFDFGTNGKSKKCIPININIFFSISLYSVLIMIIL